MKRNKGFTLVELVVVLTIIAILSSIGIASFVESSRNASMQTTQDKIISMMGVAKSRALSQTLPTDDTKCRGGLQGYEVFIPDKQRVCLTAICKESPRRESVDCESPATLEAYTLPDDISIDDKPLPGPFYFPVLGNTVEGLNAPVQITITSEYDKEKSITVNPSGVVSIGATPTPVQ